ncbi:unnamed protein product [Closterium sp. NIES-64]|nr:unnamed protein product [Closterium sp. NIES-64]
MISRSATSIVPQDDQYGTLHVLPLHLSFRVESDGRPARPAQLLLLLPSAAAAPPPAAAAPGGTASAAAVPCCRHSHQQRTPPFPALSNSPPLTRWSPSCLTPASPLASPPLPSSAFPPPSLPLPSPFPPPSLPPPSPHPPPCLSPAYPVPHEPLAARVLEDCAAAWDFSRWGGSPSNWRVGGDCDAADYIKCDANGFITDLNVDSTTNPNPDWDYNQSDYGRPPEFGLLTSGIPPCLCPLYSVPTNCPIPHPLCCAVILFTIPPRAMPMSQLLRISPSAHVPCHSSCFSINQRQIYLSDNKLSGAIPPAIGALASLGYLSLSSNNKLSGAIPPTIITIPPRAMPMSQLLRISHSTHVPCHSSCFSNNQRHIFFDNNQLSGAIPPAIGALASLGYLALENNTLEGTIPESLSTLTNLNHLSAARSLPRPPCVIASFYPPLRLTPQLYITLSERNEPLGTVLAFLSLKQELLSTELVCDCASPALHAAWCSQGAFQQCHIRPDPRRPGEPRPLEKPVRFTIHAVRMGESAMCRSTEAAAAEAAVSRLLSPRVDAHFVFALEATT